MPFCDKAEKSNQEHAACQLEGRVKAPIGEWNVPLLGKEREDMKNDKGEPAGEDQTRVAVKTREPDTRTPSEWIKRTSMCWDVGIMSECSVP